MEILACGYNFIHDIRFKRIRPNGLREYLLLIIRSTALVEISGENVRVKPDSIILIKSGMPHNIFADSDIYINDWVSFYLSDEEEKLIRTSGLVTNRFFCAPEVSFCSEIIRLMQREWLGQSQYKATNMNNFLKILICKYHELSHDPRLNKAYYKELSELRERIYASPASRYTVDMLADEIHLSKSYFHRLYKEYFHTQPIADIIAVKISYAKQLLSTTCHSVSEIAEMLGYPTEAQFIKQFKKNSGIAPGKFRKMLGVN